MRSYFEKAKKTPEDLGINDIIGMKGGQRRPPMIKDLKVTVDRENLLETASQIIPVLATGEEKKVMKVQYTRGKQNEVGHGLGPTLEFYNLLGDELKNVLLPIGVDGEKVTMWRTDTPNNMLYPKPIHTEVTHPDQLAQIYKYFELAGVFMAKSIQDRRLIDMPLSPVFWDLLLNKKVDFFSLKQLVSKNIYEMYEEF